MCVIDDATKTARDVFANAIAVSKTCVDLDILFDRVYSGLCLQGLEKSFVLIQHEDTILLLNRVKDRVVMEYCIGDDGELYRVS